MSARAEHDWIGWQHAERWETPRADAMLTAGPERIYDDQPKPDRPRTPVGFISQAQKVPEPLLWEGDQG